MFTTTRRSRQAAIAAPGGSDDDLLVVAVTETTDELETMAAEWAALCERAESRAPESYPERFMAAITELGADVRPFVVGVSRASQLVGLVVGRRFRGAVSCKLGWWRLRTPKLDAVEVVYGGILSRNSDQDSRAAIGNHLLRLLEMGTIQHLRINHVAANDDIIPFLSTKLGNRFVAVRQDAHWIYELSPGSYDKTIAPLSSKHRNGLRRKEKKLTESFPSPVLLQKYVGAAEVDKFIAKSSVVAAKAYQARLGVPTPDSAFWRSVLAAEARSGRLRCYCLEVDGAAIAYAIGVVCGKSWVLETSGYLPEFQGLSPGIILLHRIFRDLCESGMTSVDYGFGDADYKRLYGTTCWNELVVHLYSDSPRALISMVIERLVLRASRMLESFVRSTGMRQKIRTFFRKRLQKDQS